jgi:hypothetical protein
MTPGAGHSARVHTDAERLAELTELLAALTRTTHLTVESVEELGAALEADVETLRDRPSPEALAKAILIPKRRPRP